MEDHAVVMSAFTDNFNRAWLLAASAPHSSDWLHALPLSTCGLRLDNEAVAVSLRLGTSLCKPHQCPCGKQVDARGTHGLSCKRAPADPYNTIEVRASHGISPSPNTVADSYLYLTSAKAGGTVENAATRKEDK